jgi:hypothetical protein
MRDLSEPRQTAAMLVVAGVDVNELKKMVDYYSRRRDYEKFKKLVRRLSEQEVLIWSDKTKGYRRQIKEVILPVLPEATAEALWFLEWTVRFMYYYGRHKDEAEKLLAGDEGGGR